MALFTVAPSLITLTFAGSPVSFGGFMSAMSFVGGVASLVGGKWSDAHHHDRAAPLAVSSVGTVYYV
jgi:hypothetical protein